jgi:hypothetical protein
VGGLILTFKMMARASVAYEKARKAREAVRLDEPPEQIAVRLDEPPEQKEET